MRLNAQLAAAVILLGSMPPAGCGVEVLPSPQRDPPRERGIRDQLLGKQRKRERIEAAKRKKAGISGAKLWGKAKAGKL